MEPIKITDKITLRQEALRMALRTVYGVNVSENLKDLVIKRAEDIAEYLQGSADLPEYSDHDKFYTEILAKMQESFKPKPFDLWLPVDGDIKPPHDAEILGHENGSTYKCKYTDDGEYIITDGDVFHPTHWMPMPLPPFTQPTL